MLDCIQSIRFLWRKPFVAYLLLESICSSDYEILLLIPIKKNGRRMKLQRDLPVKRSAECIKRFRGFACPRRGE